jgi:hypothetical protein
MTDGCDVIPALVPIWDRRLPVAPPPLAGQTIMTRSAAERSVQILREG